MIPFAQTDLAVSRHAAATRIEIPMPHHITGKRRIVSGESLLTDWGAELVGYRSDMTRTVFPGRVPDFAHHAYQ